ncbi:MAG TPA: DUF2490 domain-containing protein [Chitinophagaceae bacterium]
MQFIRSIILIILFCFPAQLFAQDKQTTSVQQVWLGYFNQARFSNKWGAWLDLQLRTKEDFFTNFSQGIARIGLTYYVRDDVKATLGYAYINHFPAENHPDVSQPEHRAWQQVQWHNRYKRIRLMQWFRLEERWRRKIDNGELADGYLFNYRIRYNFFSQFALGKQPFKRGSVSFVLNDEVHVNFGKEIVYNYFDQNRFFAGFSYQVNDHDNLQVGYMNVFQQLAAGNRYRSIHAARVFFFHNLDLRKK